MVNQNPVPEEKPKKNRRPETRLLRCSRKQELSDRHYTRKSCGFTRHIIGASGLWECPKCGTTRQG